MYNNSANEGDLFAQIEALFETKFMASDSSRSLTVKDSKNNSKISLDIIPESSSGNEFLVSVYTNNCHLQLQSCTRFIISNMLEEVIFISETEDKISGLIMSKRGDCAMYSNVDKKVLSADFSLLSSEKLLSAVALSVTESAG